MSREVRNRITTCFIERKPFEVVISETGELIEFTPGIILGRGMVRGSSLQGNLLEVYLDDIHEVKILSSGKAGL